ncbi:MAG: 50S ribosomal protein L9 [Prevotella sp.]|nr:50S ribosomal protein L9 [Prevotella sp.]
MEIILKEDIIGLGYKNEIVNVKPGYGRNYLIPQGKGVIASPSAKKVLAENLRQQAHKIEVQKAAAQKRADELQDVVVEIAMKVSATGVTYGSVNANVVAEELKKRGFDIDRKIITMRDAKHLGEFEAIVHFYKDVEVKLPIVVVAENAPKEEVVEETAKAEVPSVEEAPAEAPVEEAIDEENAPAAE